MIIVKTNENISEGFKEISIKQNSGHANISGVAAAIEVFCDYSLAFWTNYSPVYLHQSNHIWQQVKVSQIYVNNYHYFVWLRDSEDVVYVNLQIYTKNNIGVHILHGSEMFFPIFSLFK